MESVEFFKKIDVLVQMKKNSVCLNNGYKSQIIDFKQYGEDLKLPEFEKIIDTINNEEDSEKIESNNEKWILLEEENTNPIHPFSTKKDATTHTQKKKGQSSKELY